MRIGKIVTVVNTEKYTNSFPPNNAKKFMAWLNEQLSKVPAEYADTASIDIESSEHDGESYPFITISYERQETDEEIKDREAVMRVLEDKRKERELLLLKQLKQKYEVAQ